MSHSNAETLQRMDPNVTLAQALDDLLHVILALCPTKPADNEVWQRLGNLDALRRQLQRDVGQKPTQVKDPHGRVSYAK